MSSNPGSIARRPRILVCDSIAEEGITLLREHADVDVMVGLTPDRLLTVVSGYHALVVRSATKVTAEVIDRGLNLQAIARAGAGLDNIDIFAAQKRDIQIINSPDANTLAVAEHTMALLLSLARRLPRADLSLKEGKWEKKGLVGTGLSGKTLGLVGFGRIGREVAVRAQAFGMKVLVNQRRPTPELNLAAKVQSVDLHDLLQGSDFVSLHVPLNAETRGMIGPEQIGLMKPTAYLINTARGGVIEEQALLEALNNGQIAGAALDVFVEEPATESDLARHERVIATPHIAASTQDAQLSAALTVAEQLITLFQEMEGEEILPLCVLPLEKIFPHENIDPRRLNRLMDRLEREGVLKNPPIVTPAGDKYVVLDGATRTAAFKQLGYEHIVAQITTPEAGLELRAWHHVIQDIEADRFINLLDNLPDISLQEVETDRAADIMFQYGALCYVQTVEGKAFLVKAAPNVNRLDALNQMTKAYIEAARATRTIKSDLIDLQYDYPVMTAVVIFPQYTVSQVLHATLSSGRFFPPGITRFIIPGRVLRLNADLAVLKSNMSLQEKSRWLQELLREKQSKSGIRYYAEPVYLLDE